MISVIVPIYKVEQYLRRCVDSLLRQSYRNFELILVDDGSPDGCGGICDAYAGKDSRVRVIHKENGGLSDARNAGLQIARGKYIAFVDSDDWVAPDYLEKLLNGLTETGADICECSILRTGEEKMQTVPTENTPPKVYDTVEALRQLIQDGVFHQYVWNKLYRRQTLEGIFFPEGKTNEDEFWTYQVFGRANAVARIEAPLYYYFQRPGSIMGAGYSLRRLDALEAKLARQGYIMEKFPELATLAKVNLIQFAIYSGQMTLLHLTGEERQRAREKIDRTVAVYPLNDRELDTAGRAAFWLKAAKVSFWGTCRVKNWLKRGL